MVSQTIDERSLSRICLLRAGRPLHVYFNQQNSGGERIYLSEGGLLCFDYNSLHPDLMIHNDRGPAVVFSDGSYAWISHGKYHREDGPAIKDNQKMEQQYWKEGSHLVTNSIRDDNPIFIIRDGESTIFTIKDVAVIDTQNSPQLEKSDESNADMLAIAIAALGTASLISCFLGKQKASKKPAERKHLLTVKR